MIEQRGDREYGKDRSTSHGDDRQELRSAPQDWNGSDFRSHHFHTSGVRSAWTACCARRSPGSRSVGKAVSSSGLRGVPECGYRAKTLRRHISTQHGLGRDDYLKRWGLRSDHPRTAPAYSEQRSTLAKSRRLGRRSTTAVAPIATPTASIPVDVDANTQASARGDLAEHRNPRVPRGTPQNRRPARGSDHVLGLRRHQ
jgi:hypothetical protein